LDLIIRNARPGGSSPVDIGIENGRIAAIAPRLAADGPSFDAKGRLACPGLIETHIHPDKSRIIDRCAPQEREPSARLPSCPRHRLRPARSGARSPRSFRACSKAPKERSICDKTACGSLLQPQA
jgi:hypothetical protein